MKFAEIKIPLSEFRVDVFICSVEEYKNILQNRYGIQDKDTMLVTDNECNTIESATKSPLKGEIRFALKLSDHPKNILPEFVHELWHLMWHISNTITDFRLNRETQSWAANMFEELFVSVMEAKYKKL